MYRLTTPTHRFTFPIDPNTCEIIRITYAQNDKIILTKEKPDMSIVDNTVNVFQAGAHYIKGGLVKEEKLK